MLLRRTSNYCKQSRKRVDRLRSFSLLANSQNAQYSGAGGYRLEVISRARTLPRPFIGAHAHAWRVHYGKYHLRLVAVVVFGVEFAIEGVSPFVHAECADPACIFTANLALPHRCLVLAQEAHTLAADASLALIYHAQLQLGGIAEVVGVPETGAFARSRRP